jgi:threonine aldolase
MIGALLRPWQGVISARSGHVSVHEAGAIEFGGHKVLAMPHRDGKLAADTVRACMEEYLQDDNRDHMVMPGMVYISQPTESGTLYSLAELEAISAVCKSYNMYLYADGARLAYALSCSTNDVTLQDMARLCDVFYIGGTKCGALLGEGVVIPKPGIIPHFFTLMKQHGALMAKGRVMGIQFDTLFTDDLYFEIGRSAVSLADKIRRKLQEKGLELCYGSPTNQVFVRLSDAMRAKLEEKVMVSFWEKPDDSHTVIRLATSWATTEQDVEKLLQLIDEL